MNAAERSGREEEDGSPSFRLLRNWFARFVRRRGDASLAEAIEELIEEGEVEEPEEPISAEERILLLNILKLRGRTADDVMVPRADIVAAPADISLDALVNLLVEEGHSRLPVYRETLDGVIGMVHMKDVLVHLARRAEPFEITKMLREVLFVAPSARLLDLLLEMRLKRVHMALVVDEFGGIDGLLTIEDVVEEIVGEIEDEHDVQEQPKLVQRPDGTVLADARATIEEFEKRIGPVFSEAEREDDIDTLGGLVFSLAGRIPKRGEVVKHPSGLAFEIVDADSRRIKRLKVKNLPTPEAAE
ncbi:MAG TPA: hemolysin family protein [Alphaproteobacteria bacterium]|nr:hemolysin family protein [Alphaproteobacteria bacterium]